MSGRSKWYSGLNNYHVERNTCFLCEFQDRVDKRNLVLNLPDISSEEVVLPIELAEEHLCLQLPKLGVTEVRNPDRAVHDALDRLLTVVGVNDEFHRKAFGPLLFLCASLLLCSSKGVMNTGGFSITALSGNLPTCAGVGSSAALSVAVSAACVLLSREIECGDRRTPCGCPTKEVLNIINSWAFVAETLFHGNPSGLDNTVCCFGGAIRFQRNSTEGCQENSWKMDCILDPPKLDILLTNTNVKGRSTKKQVENVGKLLKELPLPTNKLFDAIHEISELFFNGRIRDESEISTLMAMNHHILCALGVGHPALDTVMKICNEHGFNGCKLTGAGGGGCMLTLVESKMETSRHLALEDDLRSRGFDLMRTKLGGAGVCVHGSLEEAFERLGVGGRKE